MEMTRILVVLVVLSIWCSSNFPETHARPFNYPHPQETEPNEDALNWPQDSSKRTVDDFGVGEDRVDEIIAATEKWKKASTFPRAVRGAAYSQLDEIDRLKLSINKIICEAMEEGCDHMEDVDDTSAQESAETFMNLKPEEYVKVDD